jgi:hypothetical protein
MPSPSARVTSLTYGAIPIVPVVLISMGWYYAGKAKGSGTLKATGTVGFLLSAALAAFEVWIFLTPPLPSTSQAGTFSPEFLPWFASFLVGGLAVGLLAVVFGILEIITLFSAGNLFHSRLFSYAGWGRIITVVGAIFAFVASSILLVLSLLPSLPLNSTRTQPPPQLAQQIGGQFLSVFVVVLLVLMIPNLLAFQGFMKLLPEVVSPPPEGAVPPLVSPPPSPQAQSLLIEPDGFVH